MVVGQAHALILGRIRHFRHTSAELAPLPGPQARPRGQRALEISMDRPADIREDQHAAAEGLEKLEMRSQARKLGARIPCQQLSGVPTRYAGQSEALEDGCQLARIARELVSELHALEADLARLREAGLE
jgi:hypothetical protein